MEIKIESNNLSQLFIESAKKLSLEIADFLSDEIVQRNIECHAVDENSLLYEWLTKMVKIADEESLVFRSGEIAEMSDTNLFAIVQFSLSNNPIIPGSISPEISIKKRKSKFFAKLQFD